SLIHNHQISQPPFHHHHRFTLRTTLQVHLTQDLPNIRLPGNLHLLIQLDLLSIQPLARSVKWAHLNRLMAMVMHGSGNELWCPLYMESGHQHFTLSKLSLLHLNTQLLRTVFGHTGLWLLSVLMCKSLSLQRRPQHFPSSFLHMNDSSISSPSSKNSCQNWRQQFKHPSTSLRNISQNHARLECEKAKAVTLKA
ncbi:hypothetical protein H0H81_008543, partial [Sphagnurus paluster]